MSSQVIYERLTNANFMAFAIMPQATVLHAAVTDAVDTVMGALPSDTSVFLFHINCTITERFPIERNRLVERLQGRGILPLNARATNISKRAIQETLVRLGLRSTLATREGAAEERVIVKTNFNYGGEKERALEPAERGLLGISAAPPIIAGSRDYRVLPRGQVPADWWNDSGLVVERFVSNKQHTYYRAYCFMSRMVLSEMTNFDLIKKVGISPIERMWFLHDGVPSPGGSQETPPRAVVGALQGIRAAIGLDCGGIDVMIDDDGEAFVIDVNTTSSYFRPIDGLIEFLQLGMPTVNV